MSFIEDFPHTVIYDKDLGWLIDEYKRLNNNYIDLLSKYSKLIEIYEMIHGDINNITSDILKTWLEDGTIENIINNEIFGDLNNKIDSLTDRLDTVISSLETQFSNLRLELINEINALKTKLETDITNLEKNIENEMFVNGTVDIINGYPVGVMNVLNDMTSNRLSAQGMCALDTENVTYVYVACITSDNSFGIIYQYNFNKTSNQWSFVDYKSFSSLGHANDMCVYVNNGIVNIIVAIGTTGKTFLHLTSSNYSISSFTGSTKVIDIDDKYPINAVAYDSDKIYFSSWPEVFVANKSFEIQEHYSLTCDKTNIVGQGIEVKNGILFKVRTALSSFEGYPYNAINTAGFLVAIDIELNKVLKIYRFNDVGEAESCAIVNGYILYSQNGIGDGLRQCKMNGLFEYHFEENEFNIYRTPVSRRAGYFGHNYIGTNVYYDNSNVSSKAIATIAGKGSSEEPYVSMLCLSMAIRDIDSTAPKSITVTLKGNGIKTPYDRTIVLVSLQSSITINGPGSDVNLIGAMSIRSCNRVKLHNLYLAPGDSYYTDNDFLSTFGTLSIQYSTVEIDVLQSSGGINKVHPLYALLSHLRIRGVELYRNGQVSLDACITAVNTKPTIGDGATLSVTHTVGDSLA